VRKLEIVSNTQVIKEVNLTEIYRLLYFRFRVKVRPKGQGERCGGLVVSALSDGLSGPCSSPGQGHCVVFLGKTLLLSRCLSPQRCTYGYW